MKYSDIVYFKPSEEIYPLALKIFQEEKNEILAKIPPAIIEHVGASSVPGLLTAGDLDIQIRVTSGLFLPTIQFLKKKYQVYHQELWNNNFAVFNQDDHPSLPLSIMVTVIDSPDDEFSIWRDQLITEDLLRKQYNDLKKKYHGKSYGEYRAAKTEFFGGSNGALRHLRKT